MTRDEPNSDELVPCSACGGTGHADNQPDPMPCLTCRGYGHCCRPPEEPVCPVLAAERSAATTAIVRAALLPHESEPVPAVDVFELMRANARLRVALEPFARVGRGLPGNWPALCPYTVQTYPPEGPAARACPSYEGEDLARPWLLTIGDLFEAVAAYDGTSKPEGGT